MIHTATLNLVEWGGVPDLDVVVHIEDGRLFLASYLYDSEQPPEDRQRTVVVREWGGGDWLTVWESLEEIETDDEQVYWDVEKHFLGLEEETLPDPTLIADCGSRHELRVLQAWKKIEENFSAFLAEQDVLAKL